MLTPSIPHFIIILFYFLSTTSEGRTITGPAPQPTPKVPALYVFGDSLVENGNNNHLQTLAKADYYPYGVDFPKGHTHTGRFSNGKTIADLVSDFLGLPFSPPFMGSSPTNNWFTGYNYASSASGILPESGVFLGKRLNMDKQISCFESTIEGALKLHYNETELSEHLSKSIIFIVVGNNDYLNNYLNLVYLNQYKKMTSEEFSEVLLKHLSRQLKKLYSLGVRKVLISEVAPIGCMPYATITSSSTKQVTCNETKNEPVKVFNQGLQQMLSNLTSTLPDSKFVATKTYKVTHDVVNNPTQYGFENSRSACCRATIMELKCLRGAPPCKKRDKYCFWDGFHPTEAMCSFMVSRILSDPINSMLE